MVFEFCLVYCCLGVFGHEVHVIGKWLLYFHELVPGIEFLDLDMFPVIEAGTTYGFFGEVKAVRLDQDEFSIEGQTSTPEFKIANPAEADFSRIA